MKITFKVIALVSLVGWLASCTSLPNRVSLENVSHGKFIIIGDFIIQRATASSWMVTSRKVTQCKYIDVFQNVDIKDGMLFFSDGATWELLDYPVIRTKNMGSLWSTGGDKFQLWMLSDYSAVVVYGEISNGKFCTEYYVSHSWKEAKVKPLERHPVALEFESIDALFLSDDVDSLTKNITTTVFMESPESSHE